MTIFVGISLGLDYCKCGNIKIEQNPCCTDCKRIYTRKLKLKKYMKEISGYEVLSIMFKELDIESCSNGDIYHWRRGYNKRFPDVYVDTTRDVMSNIPERMYFWDYKKEKFYKQSYLICPICDDIHYKYPENDKYKKLEKYYKIQKLHNRSKNEI